MDGVAYAVEGHQKEESEHGTADGTVVLRIVPSEEDPADHGVDIQQQRPDEQKAQRARQTAGHRDQHDAQLGQKAGRAQDPGEPQQP